MHLRWLGHATVLIGLDGVRLLTDPVFGRHIAGFIRRSVPPVDPWELGNIDAVLISHFHHDHLDLASLRRLGRETRLIVPHGAARWLAARGFEHVDEMSPGKRISLGPVDVEATFAKHDGARVPFGPRVPSLGYLVEGTERGYFAGDTGLFDEMRKLPRRVDGPLDVALLPVGGWGPTLGEGGHLDPLRAAEALRRLGARRAVPIHWGTYWPAGLRGVRPRRRLLPASDFAMEAKLLAPLADVRVVLPGEEVPSNGASY